MVVIGGGTAGIAAAKAAASAGAKTCIIEQDMLGGQRLHFGEVPATAFLEATKMYHTARKCQNLGLVTT